jgi:aminobenzoyl-glutamate utilization protein B
MREIGSPTYTKEELEFADALTETIPTEQKKASMRRSKRPGWEKLLDVTMDTSIPDLWGEGEVSGGSTDVADVGWQTPTVEFSTATTVLGSPGHSWQIVAISKNSIGHKSLIFAAQSIATTAIDLLTRPDALKKVQDEFKERIQGKKYVSPLPSDLKPPLDQLPSMHT